MMEIQIYIITTSVANRQPLFDVALNISNTFYIMLELLLYPNLTKYIRRMAGVENARTIYCYFSSASVDALQTLYTENARKRVMCS